MESKLYKIAIAGEHATYTAIDGSDSFRVPFSSGNAVPGGNGVWSSEAWGEGLAPVAGFASKTGNEDERQIGTLYFKSSDVRAAGVKEEYLSLLETIVPGETVEISQPAGACPIVSVTPA